MYHEVTYAELKRRKRWRIASVVVVVLLVAYFVFAAVTSRSITRDQASISVRDAVVEAATQCCAIEGSFPPTLAHLEKDYGMIINHGDFVVKYEWLGDNVPPSVVVKPR